MDATEALSFEECILDCIRNDNLDHEICAKLCAPLDQSFSDVAVDASVQYDIFFEQDVSVSRDVSFSPQDSRLPLQDARVFVDQNLDALPVVDAEVIPEVDVFIVDSEVDVFILDAFLIVPPQRDAEVVEDARILEPPLCSEVLVEFNAITHHRSDHRAHFWTYEDCYGEFVDEVLTFPEGMRSESYRTDFPCFSYRFNPGDQMNYSIYNRHPSGVRNLYLELYWTDDVDYAAENGLRPSTGRLNTDLSPNVVLFDGEEFDVPEGIEFVTVRYEYELYGDCVRQP